MAKPGIEIIANQETSIITESNGQHTEVHPAVSHGDVIGMTGYRLQDLVEASGGNKDAMFYVVRNSGSDFDLTSAAGPQVYGFADGRIEVHSDAVEVFVDGREVHLARIAYRILERLAQERGKVVGFAVLRDFLWGDNQANIGTNNLELQLGYVRRQLGEELGDPHNGAIKTVRGFGYKALDTLER